MRFTLCGMPTADVAASGSYAARWIASHSWGGLPFSDHVRATNTFNTVRQNPVSRAAVCRATVKDASALVAQVNRDAAALQALNDTRQAP